MNLRSIWPSRRGALRRSRRVTGAWVGCRAAEVMTGLENVEWVAVCGIRTSRTAVAVVAVVPVALGFPFWFNVPFKMAAMA